LAWNHFISKVSLLLIYRTPHFPLSPRCWKVAPDTLPPTVPEVEMEQRFKRAWLRYAIGPINMKCHILVRKSLSQMSSTLGDSKKNVFHVIGTTLAADRIWFMDA